MRSTPSDNFVRLTRKPDLKSPIRFEPVRKEPGSFVLTRDGLEKVK